MKTRNRERTPRSTFSSPSFSSWRLLLLLLLLLLTSSSALLSSLAPPPSTSAPVASPSVMQSLSAISLRLWRRSKFSIPQAANTMTITTTRRFVHDSAKAVASSEEAKTKEEVREFRSLQPHPTVSAQSHAILTLLLLKPSLSGSPAPQQTYQQANTELHHLRQGWYKSKGQRTPPHEPHKIL